ncbi:MAG: hypothetical protein HDS64_08945 [Bacteroidales bacterium]|nr:hypothetical protein [Bacteroidales bacterium]
MLISPFTPLFFPSKKADGISGEYIQTFAETDIIRIQVIAGKFAIDPPRVFIEPGHKFMTSLDWCTWQINSDQTLYYTETNLSKGCYSIELPGIGTCAPFRVTTDARELENTTLIQYAMKDNRQRSDVFFEIDGKLQFFDFRVPGGFKDSGWGFGVESEQFTTDRADIIQLYGVDSVQKKFTLGNSQGCPVWFAELLNRILCCTYVYFDGERYARKDSSTPEMTMLLDGINSFVFTQNLQKVVNLQPSIELMNKQLLRRANDDYRKLNNNVNRII